MNASPPRLAAFNLFVRDLDTVPGFYARLLGLPELESLRSPIFRALDAGGIVFGFNLDAAYDLLGVADRRPQADEASALRSFHTFEIDSDERVHALAAAAVGLGGQIVKPPYQTYYAAFQAVLADPEDNVFRLNHYAHSPWAHQTSSPDRHGTPAGVDVAKQP